ncbi:hypothetical protein [Achromobacter ruhlandii]|uniref:hypothetical protein n=1 Tax=Achromobacter ruhlandii TaxID=72557 RepID=UPI001EEEB696|nr:hypothetical protein [Achromobacter ruhlandii]
MAAVPIRALAVDEGHRPEGVALAQHRVQLARTGLAPVRRAQQRQVLAPQFEAALRIDATVGEVEGFAPLRRQRIAAGGAGG